MTSVPEQVDWPGWWVSPEGRDNNKYTETGRSDLIQGPSNTNTPYNHRHHTPVLLRGCWPVGIGHVARDDNCTVWSSLGPVVAGGSLIRHSFGWSLTTSRSSNTSTVETSWLVRPATRVLVCVFIHDEDFLVWNIFCWEMELRMLVTLGQPSSGSNVQHQSLDIVFSFNTDNSNESPASFTRSVLCAEYGEKRW